MVTNAIDVTRRPRNALVTRDVELDYGGAAALHLDLHRLALPRGRVARAHQDVVALRSELARHRPPDAAVGAADERNRLIAQILFLCRSFLPMTMRWISDVPSPISSNGASR